MAADGAVRRGVAGAGAVTLVACKNAPRCQSRIDSTMAASRGGLCRDCAKGNPPWAPQMRARRAARSESEVRVGVEDVLAREVLGVDPDPAPSRSRERDA